MGEVHQPKLGFNALKTVPNRSPPGDHQAEILVHPLFCLCRSKFLNRGARFNGHVRLFKPVPKFKLRARNEGKVALQGASFLFLRHTGQRE